MTSKKDLLGILSISQSAQSVSHLHPQICEPTAICNTIPTSLVWLVPTEQQCVFSLLPPVVQSISAMSINKKIFTVVEFKIDLGLSVVPTNWISSIGGIDLCPYPDPPPKDFYKLQSNKDSLPKDGWTNLEVTCVKTSKTFEGAVAKLKRLLENKPIDSSDAEGVKRGRSSSTNFNIVAAPLAPAQPIFGVQTEINPSVDEINPGIDHLVDTNAENNSVTTNLEYHCLQVEPDPRLTELLNEFRKFQVESLRNQELLLERIHQLEKIVLNSLNSQQGAACSAKNTWSWPIKDEGELISVEVWLRDPTNYNHEVSVLSKIGGATVTKCIYNTLQWMISHELALTLRLTNKSGKISFGDKLIAKLIRDSVKRGNEDDDDATDSKINNHIGAWLRQSAERDKSRKKKNEINTAPDTEATSGEAGAGGAEENPGN
ncbi:hypothetical protein Fcan01_01660 [Folsomia candida]|uniref:Uncharacterized protein n=1 Tax=Folsomia candida TaxID=158441 RepID=A0A226F504_FOLCA|nr:hypothetical protein Fcan01_01660 [Folsomia candida]